MSAWGLIDLLSGQTGSSQRSPASGSREEPRETRNSDGSSSNLDEHNLIMEINGVSSSYAEPTLQGLISRLETLNSVLQSVEALLRDDAACRNLSRVLTAKTLELLTHQDGVSAAIRNVHDKLALSLLTGDQVRVFTRALSNGVTEAVTMSRSAFELVLSQGGTEIEAHAYASGVFQRHSADTRGILQRELDQVFFSQLLSLLSHQHEVLRREKAMYTQRVSQLFHGALSLIPGLSASSLNGMVSSREEPTETEEGSVSDLASNLLSGLCRNIGLMNSGASPASSSLTSSSSQMDSSVKDVKKEKTLPQDVTLDKEEEDLVTTMLDFQDSAGFKARKMKSTSPDSNECGISLLFDVGLVDLEEETGKPCFLRELFDTSCSKGKRKRNGSQHFRRKRRNSRSAASESCMDSSSDRESDIGDKDTTWDASGILGKRVHIQWEGMWYPAMVKTFNARTGLTRVVYEVTNAPEDMRLKDCGSASSPDGEDIFAWKLMDHAEDEVTIVLSNIVNQLEKDVKARKTALRNSTKMKKEITPTTATDLKKDSALRDRQVERKEDSIEGSSPSDRTDSSGESPNEASSSEITGPERNRAGKRRSAKSFSRPPSASTLAPVRRTRSQSSLACSLESNLTIAGSPPSMDGEFINQDSKVCPRLTQRTRRRHGDSEDNSTPTIARGTHEKRSRSPAKNGRSNAAKEEEDKSLAAHREKKTRSSKLQSRLMHLEGNKNKKSESKLTPATARQARAMRRKLSTPITTPPKEEEEVESSENSDDDKDDDGSNSPRSGSRRRRRTELEKLLSDPVRPERDDLENSNKVAAVPQRSTACKYALESPRSTHSTGYSSFSSPRKEHSNAPVVLKKPKLEKIVDGDGKESHSSPTPKRVTETAKIPSKKVLRSKLSGNINSKDFPVRLTRERAKIEVLGIASRRQKRSCRDTGVPTTGGIDPSAPYGQAAVGARLKVYWPLEKKYFPGRVKEFNGSLNEYMVTYDDGDIEWLNFSKEKIIWDSK